MQDASIIPHDTDFCKRKSKKNHTFSAKISLFVHFINILTDKKSKNAKVALLIHRYCVYAPHLKLCKTKKREEKSSLINFLELKISGYVLYILFTIFRKVFVKPIVYCSFSDKRRIIIIEMATNKRNYRNNNHPPMLYH